MQVTIYHWDLPQPLEDLGGWTNPIMADYFLNFSAVCFEEFGNKVLNLLCWFYLHYDT